MEWSGLPVIASYIYIVIFYGGEHGETIATQLRAENQIPQRRRRGARPTTSLVDFATGCLVRVIDWSVTKRPPFLFLWEKWS